MSVTPKTLHMRMQSSGQRFGLNMRSNSRTLSLNVGSEVTPLINTDYEKLDNLPSIEGVTVEGAKTAAQFGLAKSSDIPTDTSELTNNAGFVTERQAANAAPVQSVNSQTGVVNLHPEDVGALPASADLDDIPDGATYKRPTAAQVAQIGANAAAISELAGDVDGIEALIPAAASAQNQLADKTYVADSITQGTAIYRGSYATKAALLAVQWQTSDPAASYYVSNNDYAVVLADESQDGGCWRYIYVTGTGWTAQYRVNESPLTQAQLDALNSGATAAIISSVADKYVKPSGGIPESDLAAAVKKRLKTYVLNYGSSTYTELYNAYVYGYALFVAKNGTEISPLRYMGFNGSNVVFLFAAVNTLSQTYTITSFVYNTLTGIGTWDEQSVAIGSYSKPSSGIPKSDLASGVQTSLGKADTALQSVPDTYRTAAAQDVIDGAQDTAIAGKQSKISAAGILKGDGAGGVSSATAGTDYQAPLTAGTDYATPTQAAGYPVFPNFDRLTPVATYTYSVADTNAHELCVRSNTGLTDATAFDEIVLFRATVTGDGIDQVTDFWVQGSRALAAPTILANVRTLSTASATTGIRYVYSRYPKALNSGYGWALDYVCYNATERTVKIEVYADTEAWTWRSALTASSYDSNNQSSATLTLGSSRGIVVLNTVQITASMATSASYLSSYLPLYIAGTQPLAGEALPAGALIYISGNRAYKAGTKSRAITPECGLAVLSSATNSGAALTYNYVRQKVSWASLGGDSGLGKATIARGNPVYLRCTMSGGSIYSDAYLSPTMEPGYTWCYIGTAQSNTAINVDCTHPLFLTLDANGALTHVNGRALPTAPVTSVCGKTGAVSLLASDVGAGTYSKPSGGIPASDLAAGVIPTVPSAYTSNPTALGTADPGSSGSWARGDHVHPSELPTVTASDNGKVLRVVSGAWAAASLPSAAGVSF